MTLISGWQLLDRMGQRGPLLADGANGTMLMSYGIPAEDVLGANVTQSDLVKRIHSDYVDVGTQLITTNTFGLRTGGGWAESALAGLAIAESVAADAPREIAVLFSLVSSHVVPEQENLERIIQEQASVTPLLLLETCTNMAVISAAVAVLKQRLPQVPLAVTCHFNNDCKMADGTPAVECAKLLSNLGVQALGVNCCDSAVAVFNVVSQMHAAVPLPIVAQPNAGQPVTASDGTMHWQIEPSSFSAIASSLARLGASVIGGCCGTRPEHIRAAAKVLRSLNTL